MTSLAPGEPTLKSEVTNISAIGFWLLVGDREYFVPFADYPDFQSATIEQVYRIEQPSPTQVYWPDLDIDIDLNALEQPERFPLAFRR